MKTKKRVAPKKRTKKALDETPISKLFPRWYQILLMFSAGVVIISQQYLTTLQSFASVLEYPQPKREEQPRGRTCEQRAEQLRPVGGLLKARVPAYPDATLATIDESFSHVEYVTDTPARTVISFYRRELPELCWILGSDSDMLFRQGERELRVGVTVDSEGRSVIAYDLLFPRVAGAATEWKKPY